MEKDSSLRTAESPPLSREAIGSNDLIHEGSSLGVDSFLALLVVSATVAISSTLHCVIDTETPTPHTITHHHYSFATAHVGTAPGIVVPNLTQFILP
jgi:hypothetical protein